MASSSKSVTRRSSRRASEPMTPAAYWTSLVAPSERASAKPRTEVSGVRRSCDTDMRNCRWAPCARARLAAIWFTELARETSSEPSRSGTGTLAARSPLAMRLVTASVSWSGRAIRWPRRLAAIRATAIVKAEAMPNHRAAPPTPDGASRVRTTTRLIEPPLPIGTGLGSRRAAHASLPRCPLTGSASTINWGVSTSLTSSRLGRVTLWSELNGLKKAPLALTPTTASPCSCNGAFNTLKVLRRTASESWCRPVVTSSSTPWASCFASVTSSDCVCLTLFKSERPRVASPASTSAPTTMATMVRLNRRRTGRAPSPEPVTHAPNRIERQRFAELLA